MPPLPAPAGAIHYASSDPYVLLVEGGRDDAYISEDGTIQWLDGNKVCDPIFVARGYWDDWQGTPEIPFDDLWVDGDYHLQPGSRCIDAATSEDAPTTDIEGNNRPCWNGIDMGAYEYCGMDLPVRLPQFRRGDANTSGAINIADAIAVLGHLFGTPGNPSKAKVAQCPDAADANDDGVIDIADAIKILGYLFTKAGPLREPFAACGVDPSTDGIDCASFSPCE